MPRWNRDSIAAEILQRHERNEDLSYSGVLKEALPLLRAASRQFGSWRAAIEFAGLDYEAVRRYRSWTNESIVARIRLLHSQGQDLSWRQISTRIDPSLAAAATKRHHFGSWRAALEAAGLDYAAIRRYHEWSDEEVVRRIQARQAQGLALNAKSLEFEDTALITAARRRFLDWHSSLTRAGLDFRDFVRRVPSEKS